MDLESEADDEGENREDMSSLEYFEPEDFKCPLEPEADDEAGNGQDEEVVLIITFMGSPL